MYPYSCKNFEIPTERVSKYLMRQIGEDYCTLYNNVSYEGFFNKILVKLQLIKSGLKSKR